MRTFNTNLFPPDGYIFEDTDGSFHRSTGWAGLIKAVEAYRIRTGRPVGDVWSDITDQYCAKVPDGCTGGGATRTTVEQTSVSFNQQVIAWLAHELSEFRRKATVYVDDAEQHRRAQICAGCPVQRDINHGCAACVSTVEKARKVLVDDRIPQNGLKFCGALGEDLNVSTAINQKPTDKETPGNCWRK